MTEKEWLECTDPIRMLAFIHDGTEAWQYQHRATDRKLRLFASACCRYCVTAGYKDHFGKAWNKGLTEACEIAEKAADGLVELPDLCTRNGHTYRGLDAWLVHDDAAIVAAQGCTSGTKEEQKHYTKLLREIIGSPAAWYEWPLNRKEWTVNKQEIKAEWLSWEDSTVSRIAEAIYKERDFASMPILGDALENAGCEDRKILEHCHGPNTHVLGCWLLDLVLGKE